MIFSDRILNSFNRKIFKTVILKGRESDLERRWYKWYDEGVPQHIDYPKLPLKDFFNRNAGAAPEKPYLLFKDRVITYGEANSLAKRLVQGLLSLGVQKGDRVAFMIPNLPEYVISLQAVYKAGMIAVPLNPLYTVPELVHQLKDSGAGTVITYAPYAQKAVTIMNEKMAEVRQVIIIDQKASGLSGENIYDFYQLIDSSPDKEPLIDVFPEDIAMLQYTGGTTGVSKGCCLTNFNLLAMAYQDYAWFSVSIPDHQFVVLAAIPLYHIYGFNTSINMNMIAGGTIIIVDIPTPDNLIENINRFKPNYFAAVPAMIYGLNQHPKIRESEVKSIRGMICGSSPLAVEAMKKFEELAQTVITEGYGLSETSNVLTCNPMFTKRKPGTVGLPWPDVDIKIVDLEEGTKEMPIGEPGELIAKGPQIMIGYWNNPEETAKVLRDGWLYTGDIATMDEDGYITIVDRKKDMILCSGFNVYPREIDEVMYGHPKVLDACTIGIPDPKRGETVKVFLVLKPGESMTKEEVIDYCRQFLAPYKVPTEVEFITELPRTSVGKPMRRALREQEIAKMQAAATNS